MEGIRVYIRPDGLENVERVMSSFVSRGGNITPLLARVKNIMLSAVDKNFEAQGRPNRWKPRSPLTIRIYSNQAMSGHSQTTEGRRFVRLDSFRRGQAEAVQRRLGNLILSGSGDLKKSIRGQSDAQSVVVGSSLVYARIHQFGGVIVPKKYKTLGIPLGDGGKLRLKKVTIPARPYLILTDSDKKDILDKAKQYILTGRLV